MAQLAKTDGRRSSAQPLQAAQPAQTVQTDLQTVTSSDNTHRRDRRTTLAAMSFCLAAGVLLTSLPGCKEDSPPKSAGDTLKSREPTMMKTLDKFEAPETESPATAPQATSPPARPGQPPSDAPGKQSNPPASGPR